MKRQESRSDRLQRIMEHQRNRSPGISYEARKLEPFPKQFPAPPVRMMPSLRPFILARRKGHRDINLAALEGGARGKSRCNMQLFFPDQSIYI